MDRIDTSNKIICLIEMAFKGEITWLNLDLLIDGLTPNIGTSRLRSIGPFYLYA